MQVAFCFRQQFTSGNQQMIPDMKNMPNIDDIDETKTICLRKKEIQRKTEKQGGRQVEKKGKEEIEEAITTQQ